MLPLVLLIAALIGGLVAFVIYTKHKERIMTFYERISERLTEYSERLTAVISLMQILTILNSTHTSRGGAEVPSPYLEFMHSFSFLTLDVVTIVPFDCMWEDQLYVRLRCPRCRRLRAIAATAHHRRRISPPSPTPPMRNTASLHPHQ